MTSEEIRQEAEVHCNEVMCTVCENKTCTERIKCREWRDRCAGYYCGAEPRENKIADIKANCDLAIEGRDIKIKELEKKNKKLESDFRICEKNADTYYDQLTKAKDLIENIIRVTWGEGWNYSLDWKIKAEQFLNSVVEK